MKKGLLLNLFIFLNVALLAQPTINGDMGDTDYTTIASFTSGRDGFGGDNDLGVIKFYSDNTNIYIGITGETTSNDNIVLFFNFSGYGGRGAGNQLDPSGNFEGFVGVFNKSAGSGLDAARMDFDVDYALAFNEGTITTNYFIDAARYGNTDMLANAAIGSTGNQTGGSVSLDIGSTFGGTGNILIAYDNGFAGDADKGVEMQIPLAAFAGVDNTQSIELFAIITSSTGFMSNESIPGDLGASNPGNDADLSAIGGQDFFTASQLLPVELTSFSAFAKNDDVELLWETSSEINNSHFEIQHSIDGRIFETIGQVQGLGTSNYGKQYQFTHNNPVRGNNYYRLHQVDFDGKSSTSEIVSVNLNTELEVQYFPNPLQDELTILWTEELENSILELLNANGQSIYSAQLQESISIPTANLPKGVYFLSARKDGNVLWTEKVVK